MGIFISRGGYRACSQGVMIRTERIMTDERTRNDLAAARGQGWASIGIGLTEILAPAKVQEMLGIGDTSAHRGVLRLLGLREIAHGISILANDRPNTAMKAGVWSRVGGDALDTAFLVAAAFKTRKPLRFWTTASMVLGITVLDLFCAMELSRNRHFN